jgi:F-type H+-transporting ATPase subunit delta
MFQSERWADAFVGACKDKTGEGLAALKAMIPPIARLPGPVLGADDGVRVERMLRAALKSTGAGSQDEGAEYAVRFVTLLIQKGCFKHLEAVLQAVEQLVAAENGVITVNAESVSPLDDELLENIKAALKKKTGAREIRLVSHIVPELLEGYRLRIGTERIDTSLIGQIQRMTMDLHAAGALSNGISSGASRGGFKW